MRYYDITIRDPKTLEVVKPTSVAALGLSSTYSSHFADGRPNPGALDIEIQSQTTGAAVPMADANSYVSIFGVSLAELNNVHNLNGFLITIKAGMRKGLPLVKPEQAGVIANGSIQKAYGNWEGPIKSLNLLWSGPNTNDKQGQPSTAKNFKYNWKKGTSLQDMLQSTLSVAMPDKRQDVGSISPQLVAPFDIPGTYDNFHDFADAVLRATRLPFFKNIKRLDNTPYQGVTLSLRTSANGDTVVASDGTNYSYTSNTPANPKPILFNDLIGSPTWKQPSVINFKTPLRGDLYVADVVKLPSWLNSPYVLTTPGSASPPQTPGQTAVTPSSRNAQAFTGSFTITAIYQFARFRAPDAGTGWVTIFDAAIVPGTEGSGSASP